LRDEVKEHVAPAVFTGTPGQCGFDQSEEKQQRGCRQRRGRPNLIHLLYGSPKRMRSVVEATPGMATLFLSFATFPSIFAMVFDSVSTILGGSPAG